MNRLTYDNRDGNYYGVRSDGYAIVVDGDAYAEARQARMRGGMSYDQAESETAETDGWAEDLDGCWLAPGARAVPDHEAAAIGADLDARAAADLARYGPATE